MKKFSLATVPPVSYGEQKSAARKLGGIAVYARSETVLMDGLAAALSAIDRISRRHLTAARNVLAKALRDELQIESIDKRLLSALLGYALRKGVVDTLLCLSKNDVPYRVFCHSSMRDRLQSAIVWAIARVTTAQTISVVDVERHLFGQRKYNTWSSSSHVIGRLSYLGTVRFVDDFSASLVALPNGK